MRTRFWLPLLVLGICPAIALAGGDFKFTATSHTVEQGATFDLNVLFDNSGVDDVQGWSLGVCNDLTLLTVNSADNGVTTQAFNDGEGPDIIFYNVFNDELLGPGWNAGVVISIAGTDVLPPGLGIDIHIASYTVNQRLGEEDIQTEICPCDEMIGDPETPLVVVVAGLSIPAPGNCGTIDILAPPEYCISPFDCVSGIDFVNLTWDTCSPFDYLLLHRNGELISVLEPEVTEFLDEMLAPGDYVYTLIGVDFPEPSGEPILIVNQCSVTVIPVTCEMVDPGVGAYCGGEVVTLSGTGFDAAPNPVVTFGGVPAADVMVIDEFTVTCTAPSSDALVTVDVTFSNEAGSATCVQAYTYGFFRGDSNRDCIVNVADVTFSLNYLFVEGPFPTCFDGADANDDGAIRIADPIYIINFLFKMGPEPPPPFQVPGRDPTEDDLGCLE